jgi:hypothetical protein
MPGEGRVQRGRSAPHGARDDERREWTSSAADDIADRSTAVGDAPPQGPAVIRSRVSPAADPRVREGDTRWLIVHRCGPRTCSAPVTGSPQTASAADTAPASSLP